MTRQEDMVPLAEAERQVELTSERLALLHLAFARTLIDELGEKDGKKLVLKAIKDYGRMVGEQAREKVIDQGLEPSPGNYAAAGDLPKYGMHQGKEKVVIDGESRSRAYGCVMGRVWAERGEADLGRLYCYVDTAKYMAYNPEFKMVHTQALPDGDACCEFRICPTTRQEKDDFADDEADWSCIDS